MAAFAFTALPLESLDHPDQSKPSPASKPLLQSLTWDQLSPDQRTMLGQHSMLVGMCDTEYKVVEHWAAVAIERQRVERLRAGDFQPEDDPALQLKELQRGQKAATVAQARQAWKDAIEKRRVAMLALDEEVRVLHAAYRAAKNA